MLFGDLHGAVGGTVVGDHYFARETCLADGAYRFVDAEGKRVRLVKARNHDGDIHGLRNTDSVRRCALGSQRGLHTGTHDNPLAATFHHARASPRYRTEKRECPPQVLHLFQNRFPTLKFSKGGESLPLTSSTALAEDFDFRDRQRIMVGVRACDRAQRRLCASMGVRSTASA